jgi:hypothetical protein
MAAHAQHVFDWEPAGQYYEIGAIPGTDEAFLGLSTYFPNASGEEAAAQIAPFFDELLSLGLIVTTNTTTTALANDLVYNADDQVAGLIVLGSRLIPSSAYENTAEVIGRAHGELLELGF